MISNVLSFNKAGLFEKFKILMMYSSEIQRTENKSKIMIFCSKWYHSTVYDYYIFFSVNLVQDQGLTGKADMGAPPQQNNWTACKAIDGNTSQNYLSNSCAITDVEHNRNTSIWWKVWLQKKYNVAFLEIYFRSDSKYLTFQKHFNWR